MKVNIIVEQNKDGFYSCFVREDVPYVGLMGYGASSVEAIDSLIQFYNESKSELAKEGKIVPDLEFTIHYDMSSFFNRFDFLKISKVAELAGINPSLLRKYTSGVAFAGPKQYEKLHLAIQKIASELASASF
ncbi:MAG: pilus assembly protein HicB [Muribaculaceae bacterium]|nr:pilus assembly protein HicB [Muribaculaceae bacterium]